MRSFGLLGRKLGHSFSPRIHSFFGDYAYPLYEKEPEEIPGFLKNGAFDALNVTVPYKETVIPYLSELTPRAQKIGAVNLILRDGDRLIGDNSDYYGFSQMLSRVGADVREKKALILGSGGAAKMVRAVLADQGAGEILTVSRTGKINYQNVTQHTDAYMIVNATPVGMYPDNYAAPLDLAPFVSCEYVLDLIYNPLSTRLMLQAQAMGKKTCGGLWMLIAQAREGSSLFTGEEIDDAQIGRIYDILSRESRNIVLIGMPGSGKSTAASILARVTGRDLFCLDQIISLTAGMPIPEIFAQFGEDYFRELETFCLREYARRPGCILDCGGGIVTRKENFEALRQNGFVVFLNRGWSSLPTEGRPLSEGADLREMYETRLPLYREVCDTELDTSCLSPEETAKAIMEAFEK